MIFPLIQKNENRVKAGKTAQTLLKRVNLLKVKTSNLSPIKRIKANSSKVLEFSLN